jgi:regulatory protein
LSAGELREKLRRKAEGPADVEHVIAKLKEYGYVNDAQFAETYASARRDSQGFGKMRVLSDLRRRRVAPTTAEKAVATAYEGVDEVTAIEQYLQRKYRSKKLNEFLAEEKNLASAYRRLRYAGFSSGASIRVLKRYAAQADELEDLEAES